MQKPGHTSDFPSASYKGMGQSSTWNTETNLEVVSISLKTNFLFKGSFFGITFFLYQNENPVDHMIHGRQFYASLTCRKKLSTFVILEKNKKTVHTFKS